MDPPRPPDKVTGGPAALTLAAVPLVGLAAGQGPRRREGLCGIISKPKWIVGMILARRPAARVEFWDLS